MKKVRRFFARAFKTERHTNAQNIEVNFTTQNFHDRFREELVENVSGECGSPRIEVTEIEFDCKSINVAPQQKSSFHATTCSESKNKKSLLAPSLSTDNGKLEKSSRSLTDVPLKDGPTEHYSTCESARQLHSSLSAPPSPSMQTDVKLLKIHTKFSNENLHYLNPPDLTPYCSSTSLDNEADSIEHSSSSTSIFPMSTTLKRVQTTLKMLDPSQGKAHLNNEKMCSLSNNKLNCESADSVFDLDVQEEEDDDVFCCVESNVVVSNVSSERSTRQRKRIYSTPCTEREVVLSVSSTKHIERKRKSVGHYHDASDIPSFHKDFIKTYGHHAKVRPRSQSVRKESPSNNRFKGLEELDQATRRMLEIDIVKPLSILDLVLNNK